MEVMTFFLQSWKDLVAFTEMHKVYMHASMVFVF